MSELNLEGMAIAPGVVETIVSIAVREVDQGLIDYTLADD